MAYELEFWAFLRSKFPRPYWRIESKIATGLPDVLCFVGKRAVAVELKSAYLKFPLKLPYMRSIQVHTGHEFIRNGQAAFFLMELRGLTEDWVALIPADRLGVSTGMGDPVAESQYHLDAISWRLWRKKELKMGMLEEGIGEWIKCYCS